MTESEFAEIRTHPLKGRNIIDPVSSLNQVGEVIFHHHEHWNGNGYPDGLVPDDIPLMSRIIGIADAFDAMTSKRPCRSSLSIKEALIELHKGAGHQFDPELVTIFISLRYEVRRLLVGFRESGYKVIKEVPTRFRESAGICK